MNEHLMVTLVIRLMMIIADNGNGDDSGGGNGGDGGMKIFADNKYRFIDSFSFDRPFSL